MSIIHGAYVAVRAKAGAATRALAEAPIDEIAGRFGLGNEFDAPVDPAAGAVAFLRRIDATAADTADEALLNADAIVHVASGDKTRVDDCCLELVQVLSDVATTRVLRGAAGPTRYTGGLMQEFAYAHQRTQERGDAMPHAFLLPMSKTAEWWSKDWMERHTYFLPRYDDRGHMTHQGHVVTAAPGIPHLMRRTYRHVVEPAPTGEYDFLTYFECGSSGVPVFEAVCKALRDVEQNPEWAFVREGPRWHGKRVKTWGSANQSEHEERR